MTDLNTWYPWEDEGLWIADLGVSDFVPGIPPESILDPYEICAEIDYFAMDTDRTIELLIDDGRWPGSYGYNSYGYWRSSPPHDYRGGASRDYDPFNTPPRRIFVGYYGFDYDFPAPYPPYEPVHYVPGLSFKNVKVEEAIGPAMNIVGRGKDSYVHLLSQDIHSTQTAVGYRAAVFNGRRRYSYERWIRVSIAGEYVSAGEFSFWVDSFTVPPGWDIKYGVASTYRTPIATQSDIATLPLPTSAPSQFNAGFYDNSGAIYGYGPDATTSRWVVLQAYVSNPELIEPGSIRGSDTAMIQYHFGWIES